MPLLALTVHQPWAWSLAERMKPVENRGWEPPKAAIGQPLAIHAGKEIDEDGFKFIESTFGVVVPRNLPQGAIIAVGVLDRVVSSKAELPSAAQPWFFGPKGWVLRDVVGFEPVVCRGFQKLWSVPEELLPIIRSRYAAARRSAA